MASIWSSIKAVWAVVMGFITYWPKIKPYLDMAIGWYNELLNKKKT